MAIARSRGRCIAWLLALAVVGTGVSPSPGLAQTKKENRTVAKAPEKPRPADIDRNGLLILVRTTLLALDQANKTGNYTVLRDLGAPDFQANNAARLAEVFSLQRKQGLDLSGVATLEPQITLSPQIEPNGMLHLAGFFPSAAMQLNFELIFAPVNRQWKISGMSVQLGASAPAAPDGPSATIDTPDAEPPEAPSATITTKETAK